LHNKKPPYPQFSNLNTEGVTTPSNPYGKTSIDILHFPIYRKRMITTIRHKGLKRLYDDDDRSKLPADMVDRISRVLALLDSASTIEDMDQPSLRLHALKGDLKNYWAVTVRANWRITFRFMDAQAFDVDFVDYH
jgi:toxin HigB-1